MKLFISQPMRDKTDEQIKSESFFKTLEGYIIYPGHETPVKFDTGLFKWYSK